MKVGINMIEPGNRISITVKTQNREAYFAVAEVVSISNKSITIKYVCKVHDDKQGNFQPEFKTESFLMAKEVTKIQKLL